MKRTIISAVLLASVFIGHAQDASFKADALKVIQMSGGTASMELAKASVVKMVPTAKQAAFLVEFNATMPALYDKLVAIYTSNYTHDELLKMIEFYNSPVGKKITAQAGPIAEQGAKAGEEWGKDLQPMLMKYME